MRKDIGKRLIALCMAALYFYYKSVGCHGNLWSRCGGGNYAEEVQQEQNQQVYGGGGKYTG